MPTKSTQTKKTETQPLIIFPLDHDIPLPEAAQTKRYGDVRLKITTTLENMQPSDSFAVVSQHLVGEIKYVAADIDVRVAIRPFDKAWRVSFAVNSFSNAIGAGFCI
jgi:hypothetical protein